MKRATFNIHYYIKRTKLLKNGDAPVYMRITLNGENAEISLKRSIKPSLWDTTRNKAKGTSPEAAEINDYLTSVRGQLFMHQRELQEAGKTITAKILLNTFLGIGEKQWSLVELFEEHNKNVSQLIGKEYSPLTFQRYEAALKHIRNYCRVQYNNENLPLSEVNNKFITGFDFYLKTIAKCQHNSSMKHIKALKKVIRIAIASDYIRKDPFVNYRITQKNVEREYLTQAEIDAIIKKEITIQRLDVIRDLFIFQCYTGFAYKDLAALKKENIEIGIDVHKWIVIRRGKTGVTCRIPIFPVTESIIKKYASHAEVLISGKLLPVPSNQKMNAYLKEVAAICGIDKDLHSHLGRHSYATTITLSNGIPMETISRLLGHTKISTTQIYSRVVDKKVEEDIEKLRIKLG
ncbi:MAG: site-specific integrase [Flavobacteriia bacterium]